MADHIPFVTGEDAGRLVKKTYSDARIVRIPLDRATKLRSPLPNSVKVWLDPSVDGMDDVDTRRSQEEKKNPWFEFMSGFANFARVAAPGFQAKPIGAE